MSYSGKIEVIVGLGGGATNVNQIANAPPSSYTIVNNSGQLLATVTSLVPMLRPINIQTNTFAGTTMLLKIGLDIKKGKKIDVSDVLSVVSNVSGIVATIAFFAGAPATLGIATAVGLVAGASALLTSDEAKAIKEWMMSEINLRYASSPIVAMPNMYAAYCPPGPSGSAPRFAYVPYQDISPQNPAMCVLVQAGNNGAIGSSCGPINDSSKVDPPPNDDTDGDGG